MDDLGLAASLVRDAGALAAQMLAAGLETQYKTSRSDVVSAADRAAEQLVAGRLADSRPDDAQVGEEGARRGDPAGRTWFIDPVDGTFNFLAGTPYWCSAVGLADADGPLLGAVYYPAVDELWLGGRDLPTTCNGVAVEPLVGRALHEVSINTYLHPTHLSDARRNVVWQAVVGRAATLRMMGSASIDLAAVAGGRAGLFLQADLRPWDWVPGAALVVAAGGAAEVVEAGGHRWHAAGSTTAVAEARDALLTADASG